MSDLAIRGGRPVYAGTWPAWPVHDEREVERVVKVVRGGKWGYNGPVEQEFREAFARYQGSKHVLCVTNGTHALQLALEALDVGAGDEVIVPGMTWQATAAAVLDVNAVPILTDIEPETLTLDPRAVRAALTPRTKALIPVHLFSCVAHMDEILAIAAERKLAVIEDCSHQHGAEWRGKKVGSLGAIGAFSLQMSKVFTAGEGGLLTTNDDRLACRLDSLRNCGRRSSQADPLAADLALQSGNFRMTEMQAALLLAQLERLPEQVARRDENAQYLSKLLAEIPGLTPLKRRPQITRQSYYGYAFRYDQRAFEGLERSRFAAALKAEVGLGFGGIYEALNACELYRPHTKQRHHLSPEYLKQIDPRRFELPACKRACDEIVNCIHYFLLAGSREMEAIAEAARKIQRHAGELAKWEAPALAEAR